jgi:hypothetical protein
MTNPAIEALLAQARAHHRARLEEETRAATEPKTETLDQATLDLLGVVEAARKGDPVADRSLREAAAEHLSWRREMHPLLATYAMEVLLEVNVLGDPLKGRARRRKR